MKDVLNIYIVDNDPIYQLVIGKLLRNLDHEAKIYDFLDGSNAFEFLTSLNNNVFPNIILLDLDMPMMDGWEFMEAFENWKHPSKNAITIYIVSSSLNSEDINKAKKYPAIKEYITKPISKTKIESILNTIKNS